MKKLQDDVKGKANPSSDPKTDEEKLKIMGLKTTSNIQTLIRDLYHPNYKAVVHLSWVNEKSKFSKKITIATESDNGSATPKKRHAPITFTSDSPKPTKQSKNSAAQKMYSPPSGKYSSNVSLPNRSNFGNRSRNNNNKFRNGGEGKRGFRGKSNRGRY